MCTRPLLITNKKYKFSSLSNSVKKIIVPCGDCEECLRAKANSIYIRARFEYQHCIENGGIGFMCCLTYDNSNLPFFHSCSGRSYPVFNKQHVIDFIKRLRINLDRSYAKTFNSVAPRFKYLVCSEYGSKHHRPHYHLLFFFSSSVSVTLFQKSFNESTIDRKTSVHKRFFGRVLQCVPIDPKRGGIHYSSKYVCKDINYKEVDNELRDLISFKKHDINLRFGIVEDPVSSMEVFRNRCIRINPDYRKAVENELRPLRHMLQFCMCSNDLGGNAIVDHYGDSLETLGCVSVDGFNYSIPSIVKVRYEERNGFVKLQRIKKLNFISSLSKVFDDLVYYNYITSSEASDLLEFSKEFVCPFEGRLIIRQPDEVFGEGLEDWNYLVDKFTFYEDNGFFDIVHRLSKLLYFYNFQESDCKKFRYFRSKLLFDEDYNKHIQKRKNKGYE